MVKRLLEKHSAGIACCRINHQTGLPEILLVCKRVSYAYYDFVTGNYDHTKKNEILSLLNKMTVDEKLCILSLDFSAIWYRIWLNNIPKSINFFALKAKFDSNFKYDGGTKIKQLISHSKSIQNIWEIPKGRKERGESDQDCAIREFEEETGINKRKYQLYSGTRMHMVIDRNVKYISKYFIAFCNIDIDVDISFRKKQTEELREIRWMTLNEVNLIDHNNELHSMVKPIMNYVKKQIKGKKFDQQFKV